MIQNRVILLAKVDEDRQPFGKKFACLDCPFSNLQTGFTSGKLEILKKDWSEKYNSSKHEEDEKLKERAIQFIADYRTVEEYVSIHNYNYFSVYCTKTAKFTFNNNPKEYHHFESCEFKDNSINETIVEG